MAALTLRATNYIFASQVSTVQTSLVQIGDTQITYVVVFPQQHPPLAVSDDRPVDLGIPQLLDANLTREGAIGLVVDVLRRDGDLRVGQLAGQQQVDGRRGNDDFGVGVTLGLVEVVDDGCNGVDNSIPDRQRSCQNASMILGAFVVPREQGQQKDEG